MEYSIRSATINDLDAIFNVIQSVGNSMLNDEWFV